MTETRQCSHCGGELPEDAPLGLCPRCVLNVGVNNQRPTVGTSDGQPAMSPASAFVPPAPADLAPLFPQLEILELLGQGGMGAVYKARQPGLDRLVALKILPPGLGADPAFAERFTREARSLARLSHPNVVAIYDFGQAGDLYYFLMEYVDGVNLRQMQRVQRLDPKQALDIVMKVCEALQYAHDEGIVHRDIKPENLLVDKKGRVKIADFGLAKLLGRSPTDFTLTSAGQMLGTPAYMAPEQVERPGIVDQRADIYSLGVVFYEMLTGELPLGRFQAPSQMVQVDVRLDEVVLKALEKQPERRYQHASEVRTDVEQISRGPQAPAAPAPAAAAVGEAEAVRHRLHIPAIGLIVAGALTCLGGPLFLGWAILQLMAKHAADEPGNVFPGFSETAILCCVAFSGILVVLGAVMMLRMKSYGLAVAACILALLPCTLGFPVGLVMGIWALIVLSRKDVKAAFGGAKGRGAGGPAVTEKAAPQTPPPSEQPGNTQGGLPAQAAAQHSGKGRRNRTAWIVAIVAVAIVGALLLLLAIPIVGGLVVWLLFSRPSVHMEPAEPMSVTAAPERPSETTVRWRDTKDLPAAASAEDNKGAKLTGGNLSADISLQMPNVNQGKPFPAIVGPDYIDEDLDPSLPPGTSGVMKGPTSRPTSFHYERLPVLAIVPFAKNLVAPLPQPFVPWDYGQPLFKGGSTALRDRRFSLAHVGWLTLTLEADGEGYSVTQATFHDTVGSKEYQLTGTADVGLPPSGGGYLWYRVNGLCLHSADNAAKMDLNDALWRTAGPDGQLRNGWPGAVLDKNLFPLESRGQTTRPNKP